MRRVSEREPAIRQFAIASWIHSYFDNVMTKFMINNRTDALKTEVNLLNVRVVFNIAKTERYRITGDIIGSCRGEKTLNLLDLRTSV